MFVFLEAKSGDYYMQLQTKQKKYKDKETKQI